MPFNRHALLRAAVGDCYVMINRTLKIIGGSLRLRFARVHHIGAPEVFVCHLEKLVVRVAASLKVVAMIVDDRLLQGTAPWHSFMRPGGERKAAFRSKRLTGEDIDGLYTEAILLNYLLTKQAAEKLFCEAVGVRLECDSMQCVIPLESEMRCAGKITGQEGLFDRRPR